MYLDAGAMKSSEFRSRCLVERASGAHDLGSAKLALHLTLNLYTFWGRRRVMNSPGWPSEEPIHASVLSERRKTIDKSGDANANPLATKDEQ